MPTPTTDAPDVLASDAASAVSASALGREDAADDVALAASQADAAAPEESFKQLLRDFVLGNHQNPDDMPGLRFYIVFAGMLILSLLGVIAVAALISLIRWAGLLFR
ncbi:MAG: hypothetical protein CFK52_05075 [Chloracidobacterium sp. CP2_5A]|nr:MAG: hypothetical protein CFK52_05075 [Chloracidobacterium sp. CP2_5A]